MKSYILAYFVGSWRCLVKLSGEEVVVYSVVEVESICG